MVTPHAHPQITSLFRDGFRTGFWGGFGGLEQQRDKALRRVKSIVQYDDKQSGKYGGAKTEVGETSARASGTAEGSAESWISREIGGISRGNRVPGPCFEAKWGMGAWQRIKVEKWQMQQVGSSVFLFGGEIPQKG